MKPGNDPSTIATLYLRGEAVTLLLVHPRPPIHRRDYDRQVAHFQYWQNQRKQYASNLIIIGDLNTTPWSSQFQQLTQNLSLRDSRLGYGLLPSWSAFPPMMMIPIDHVLVSPNFHVSACQTLTDIGSDHLPLEVVLQLESSHSG